MHFTLTTESIKQFNFNLIYRLICQNAPISRIQLAELTELAPATITKIVRDLLKINLIQEVETQQSTGGRPAISIKPLYDHYQVIAINLTRSHFKIELYDLGSNKLAQLQFNYQDCFSDKENKRDAKEIQSLLIEQISAFKQKQHSNITNLLAIGLVLPGVLDPKNQNVIYAPHLSFTKPWALSEALSTHFNVPTLLGNDVQSLAIAESFLGAAQKQSDFIFIRTHHGVGAGIILNHQLLHHSKQSNSEIGHIQVDPLGDLCHCGHFGCLETKISDKALRQIALDKIAIGFKTDLTNEDLKQNTAEAFKFAIEKKDILAVQIIEQAAENLGKVLSTLVNIFNPESIVIAGTFAKVKTIALPIIKRSIKHYALTQFTKEIKVICSDLDDQSAIGGFALIQHALFESDFLLSINERLQVST